MKPLLSAIALLVLTTAARGALADERSADEPSADEPSADEPSADEPSAKEPTTTKPEPPAKREPPEPPREFHLGVAGLHAAYAPGIGIGYASGFRHQLDAGVMTELRHDRTGSRDGMWSSGAALILGAAVLTGFGATPTYAMLEVGQGYDTTIAALGIVVGPSFRFGALGGGVTGRVVLDLLGLQLGLRFVTTVITVDPDAQLAVTIGLGRF